MKHILKYLTITGVLILFLPFFRMCSGTRPAQKVTETVDSIAQNVTTDTLSSINIENIDSINKAEDDEQKAIDKKDTYSGYGLGISFFKMIFEKNQNVTQNSSIVCNSNDGFNLKEEYAKIKTVKDFFLFVYSIFITYFPFLFFVFIILNSFLLVFYSFKNKFKKTQTIAIINVCLIIFAYFLMYLGFLFYNFDQIKFGSYLFVINSLLIIYFSFKNKKLTTDVAN